MARNKKLNRLRKLHEKQGGKCVWCGGHAYLPGHPLKEIMEKHKVSRREAKKLVCNIEHIMPRSLGGTNRGDNLCMAHMGCNVERGNSPLRPCISVFKTLTDGRKKMFFGFGDVL